MNDQPITLGAFMSALSTRPPEQEVSFEFASLTPTDLGSYRGYYDHLALGYSEDGSCTVAKLLDECRGAIGKVYEGYKGGDFRMHAGTPLWVANYGRCGSTAIVGLRDCRYWTYIATAFCEDWDGGPARALEVLAGLGFGNAHRAALLRAPADHPRDEASHG